MIKFTDEVLAQIRNGQVDKFVITAFLNKDSYTIGEISLLPYNRRKEYDVELKDGRILKVFAIDDESLRWYLVNYLPADSVNGFKRTEANIQSEIGFAFLINTHFGK